MRRSLAVLAVLGVLAAGCSSSAPTEAPVGATAEVVIEGQPNAITHGDDPMPVRPRSLVAQIAPEAAWPCEGTGQDGRRAQMIYAHGAGGSLTSGLRQSIETWTRQIEGIFLSSARDSGGERLLRFVTGPGCSLSVLDVTLSANGLGSFDAMISELRAQGLTNDARLYHAFVDSQAYCGIGTVYTDDRPTGNLNEQYAQYSRSDRPCWTAQVAAHELVHNAGGVQNSAPNSTGGLHCRDEKDVMCYADGAPKGQMRQVCADPGEDRLDCGKDDYFSVSPPAGSYLSTHWNVADSSALSRGAVSTTSTTTPPQPTTTTSTTLPPTTSTTTGKGETTTDLVLPRTIRSGEKFTAVATVSGECGPSGTVGFYVSGRLMSSQVLANGAATAVLTLTADVARPTIRADYSGSEACATSRDSARKVVR